MSNISTSSKYDDSREEITANYLLGLLTLNCRTIRIGSYRYTPKEKIYISSKGIKIVAPNLKSESRDVALQIQLKEVFKILVHFGKGLPVIFLYTGNKCGAYIRKMLDMTEELGPYYNPMSESDQYKRITLLPDSITEEAKATMTVLFGRQIIELNSREANEILMRTSSNLCILDGSRKEITAKSFSGLVTLNCHTIEIGSYRYTPKEKVLPINQSEVHVLLNMNETVQYLLGGGSVNQIQLCAKCFKKILLNVPSICKHLGSDIFNVALLFIACSVNVGIINRKLLF